MKVDHASIMILKILKNIYHSFYHEKIWKDYYKMRAQFSFLNDEAPSKGEEEKCILPKSRKWETGNPFGKNITILFMLLARHVINHLQAF